MDRREFIARATGLAGGLALGACSVARVSDRAVSLPASLAVDLDHPGQPIPPDFIGLSYEASQLLAADYFSPRNQSIIGLIRRLGSYGVLAVGGGSKNNALWRTAGAAEPVPQRFVITPATIDRLAEFLRTLGWRLIYNLNVAKGTPEEAAAEAAYVAKAVETQLLAFQIGAEPDLFPGDQRQRAYNVRTYIEEWNAFFRAVRARVPDAPFAGPAALTTSWVRAFAQQVGSQIVLLTHHYYAAGPASSPAVTLEKLLRPDARLQRLIRDLQVLGREYRLPFRIPEANSVFEGGKTGVSDTLASALWGADVMFQLAEAGCAGINFHVDPGAVYTPIAGEGGVHSARPLFYGMLLFAQAGRGRLLPVRLQASQANLSAYAVRAADGSLWITLINKDLGWWAHITADAGGPFKTASVLWLTAPSPSSQGEIKLGGAAVGSTGAWTPSAQEVEPLGRRFVIDVPYASAVAIHLTPF